MSLSSAASTPFEVARILADQAGDAAPLAVQPLTGGKNNKVFSVELSNGAVRVLKSYFVDERDQRDRRASEWNFLTHAWKAGVRNVPQPLATDATHHSSWMTHLTGRKFKANEVMAHHVACAAQFVAEINAPGAVAGVLASGSEACFSIAQHIETIERRVARLSTLAPDAPHVERAAQFVDDVLGPAWTDVRDRIQTTYAGEDFAASLTPDRQCISPSDFGFHNALVDADDQLSFLDFEYAGVDDPAKLYCDFFCQPEIPAPLSARDVFLDALRQLPAFEPADAARCRNLLDAYRVKWVCIILNDFLPVGAARRQFANLDEWGMRCLMQLDRAKNKIAQIGF